MKHFESSLLWKDGLSDFVDLVFSLVGREGVLLVCLVGVPRWFSEDAGVTLESHPGFQ